MTAAKKVIKIARYSHKAEKWQCGRISAKRQAGGIRQAQKVMPQIGE